jgi:hypothetical protein
MATSLTDVSTISGVLNNVAKYRFNPAGIQRVVLQHLRDVSAGQIEIVDPTNPFVFCVEASAVNVAAFMIESEANTRKQYPSVSQTAEDLYIHMSDKDFIDRFATPSSTTFSIMIQKEDLLSKLVYDPVTQGSKVTIPRNSEFIVADTTFSLQYAINIQQLIHGGLDITYDTTEVSPLQDLTTNAIPFEIRNDANGQEWIYFEFLVQQFRVNSVNASVSEATGFKEKIVLTDDYYYSRVYYKNSEFNTWKEIYTTHTDQVYDPNRPTAVLTLIDKNLTVEIPQVYLSTGQIKGTVRIDVYETKGPLNISLDSFRVDAFSAVFKNIDKANDNVYTAVIPTLNILSYSFKKIVGGSPALTYDQLRQRVITNAIGDRNVPITNIQIESSLEKKGYSVVKNIDVVTNRVFLASRALPLPNDPKLITAGASSIETVTTSIEKAITFAGVKNNGLRITLTPDIVYVNKNGIVEMVTKQQIDLLLSKSPDDIALIVTNSNFLYTPFHYVLDTTQTEFKVRPYFLDKPVAQTVKFVTQNDTSGIQVNTNNYALTRTPTGYKLTVSTKSNKAYKDLLDSIVFTQLSYVPVGEQSRAYLNGTLVGVTEDGERIWDFDLSTNFDVDLNDDLTLQRFSILVAEPRNLKTPLTNEFDIIYATNVVPQALYTRSSVDDILGDFILPDFTFGITQEKIRLVFGFSLDTLWARSRSIVTSANFTLHQTNIPWLYEKDVYATNGVTGSNFSFDGSGNIVYTKLHSAGDPILDQNGLPTFRYRVGDVVLDNSGNPVPLDTAKVNRQVDMMFIEGAYYFATDAAAANYRDDIVDTVVEWLNVELRQMGKTLLEKTSLFFYPKTTMGSIKALTDDGLVADVEANQFFRVKLFVSNPVYQNTELRESLTKATIATIDLLLKEQTISISTITSQLRQVYGNDVISLTVSGLGGEANLAALTVINSGERCNIRKRLVKLPDDKLIVSEDVTVDFIRYDSLPS